MENIKDLIQYFSNIEQQIKDFNSDILSLNNDPLGFNISKKIVLDFNDGYIYKIAPMREGLLNWMISGFYSSLKLNVFVKVDLIWFSENLQLTITREPKVKVIKEISDEEIFNAFGDNVKKHFNDEGIKYFNIRNCGKDENGRIKIFDYISNCDASIFEKSCELRDRTGNLIFSKEISL